MALQHYPSASIVRNTSILQNKVFWLSLFTLILIAVLFWTQSRIPALTDKAQLGDRVNISAIAFDIVLPVDDAQPLYERVFREAINWGYTNWKGMSFGFLFAAAFISLLQLFSGLSSARNPYLNSVMGLGMGAPMGVCVNCATPIAQGLIHGGTRLETSLSMLMASPTLNPIVLTILFTILPFYLAVIKTVAAVIFIVLFIPLLIKMSGLSEDRQVPLDAVKPPFRLKNNILEPLDYRSIDNWSDAFLYLLPAFFKNLLYVLKIALPLMILAGFLGAFLIEVLPKGSLSGLSLSPASMLVIASVGAFLPVPIAFDVIMVNVLISAGLDIGLASILLFSLGIFSIYPAMVIGRYVSLKLSVLIFLSVIIVSIMVGLLSHSVGIQLREHAELAIEKEFDAQRQLKSFNQVIDICQSFKDKSSFNYCVNKGFSDNAFIKAGVDICNIGELDKNTNTRNAQAICSSVYKKIFAINNAIKKRDIALCQSSGSEKSIDECRLAYIRDGALNYSSLDICSKIQTKEARRYCRYAVIADRMAMKSEQACELNLSADMHRQCIDNLNAHIASETLDLSECNKLPTDNAIRICRSTVVSLKISRFQDYSICKKLSAFNEVQACEDQVIMQRSLAEKNPSICGILSDRRMLKKCYVDGMIRKNQSRLLAMNLSTFSDDGGALVEASDSNKRKMTQPLSWTDLYKDDAVSIAFVNHRSRDIHSGKIFSKISGDKIGLYNTWKFNLTDFMEPFIYGKGLASGDFNNDGWSDLAFASSNGLYLYQNNGDGSFSYVQHLQLDSQALNGFVVSFVDINNDGWQDLFLSAYGSHNVFFINKKAEFFADNLLSLPLLDNNISLSAGFADWNKDGYLDVVLGNWSYGAEGAFIPEKSQNVWYVNHQSDFTPLFPDEIPGESLSVLMSDINNDGNTDLFVANDRKYPDALYLGKAGGQFKPLGADMGIIKQTSLNTMSYDSADFNNDLRLDIFSTDMAVAAGDTRHYCDILPAQDKRQCEWLLRANSAVDSLDVSWCSGLQGRQRTACYSAMAIALAKRDKNSSICSKVSDGLPAKIQFCQNIARHIEDISLDTQNSIEQLESNKLLINTENNGFIDATESMGVKNSFWGWTAKAADLDNDGWQDIYIGNGLGFGQQNKNIHSNIFYHNQQGKGFVQAEDDFGLTNYINTPAYTYVDFDLDGDLDIISSGVMSGPSVFINQGTDGNSISFVLRDNQANKFCIGCKLIIHYDNGKKSQIRELKLSGGFMSFDDPVMYFGLGEYQQINGLEIIWSTGERWEYPQHLQANRRYKISRHIKQKMYAQAEK